MIAPEGTETYDSTEDGRGPARVSKIAAGIDHTCALTPNGLVYCWGSNRYGQLGVRPEGDEGLPVYVEGIEGAREISAGVRETCVLGADDRIRCWGDAFGPRPVVMGGPPNVAAMSVGFGVVVLTEEGEVYVYDGPAPGHRDEAPRLTRRADLEDIIAVSAGLPRCALHQEGRISCWTVEDYSLWPGQGALVEVEGVEGAQTLSEGLFHHCAIDEDRAVKCWGLNRYGGLGNGASGIDGSGLWRYSVEAVPALGVREAREVVTGGLSSCALLGDEQVKCWGANTYGQLGLPVETPQEVIAGAVAPHVLQPTTTPKADSPVTMLVMGFQHRCALLEDETITCWGLNSAHQLGVPYEQHVVRPKPVPAATSMVAVRGGWDRTCGLTEAGEVRCWGGLAPDFDVDLHQGEVFDIPSIVPRAIRGVEEARAIAMHTSHACGLGEDKILTCFGKNSAAALGPETSHVYVPEGRAFVELGAVETFDVGGFHTCVIREDRSLWCWGGINGRVGMDSRVLTPRQIEGLGEVDAVAGGGSHSCARRQDGRVFCWGEDLILGRNGLFDEESLLEIPDFRDAVELSAGEGHVCARLPEGQVRCLGALPVEGPFGLMYPDPPFDHTFHVEGFEDIVQLAGGEGFVCGRRSNGTVRCMGRNDAGQLGDGTTTSRARADDVVDLQDVIDLGVGRHHACAVVQGGQVHCWGLNRGMQLGIEAAFSAEGYRVEPPRRATTSSHHVEPPAERRN